MKKVLVLLILTLFLTGCFRYGGGTQAGYVSAIEQGILWDRVYLKPTLESTQEDVYLVGTDQNVIFRDLKNAMVKKVRIQMDYAQHLVTITQYSRDEVTGFKILEEDNGNQS